MSSSKQSTAPWTLISRAFIIRDSARFGRIRNLGNRIRVLDVRDPSSWPVRPRTMSAVLASRERERMRQMELEAQRAAEQVAMLEVSLASAREFAEKAAVSARWKLGAANERARLAEARAAALEEAMATTVYPVQTRYALGDKSSDPRISPHGAMATRGTSLSSPLTSPRGKRRGDSAADLVDTLRDTQNENAEYDRDDRYASEIAPRHGAVAHFAELVTWRARGKTARVFFGGLYVQLCVQSLRTMPLPFWTVACSLFIFALAGSLVWRTGRGLRVMRGGHVKQAGDGGVGNENESMHQTFLTSDDARRRRREQDARRFAAKFGGWIAASAAARAPLAAEFFITLERTFTWEHPPSTLKACSAVWLMSNVARVWTFGWERTLLMAWLTSFLVPPVLVRIGPSMGDAARVSVDDLRTRFSYLLTDRKVQLAGLLFAWSATGVAGRTLLALAVATAFLTREGTSHRGTRAGNDTSNQPLRNPGVTITELPNSPERVKKTTPRNSVEKRLGTPERLAAAETRPPLTRPSRGAREAFQVKTTTAMSKRESTSSESDSPPPRREAPAKRLVGHHETAKQPIRDRYAFGSVTNTGASAARQRMIAERTRRILDDD